jgi:hypothetical protein
MVSPPCGQVREGLGDAALASGVQQHLAEHSNRPDHGEGDDGEVLGGEQDRPVQRLGSLGDPPGDDAFGDDVKHDSGGSEQQALDDQTWPVGTGEGLDPDPGMAGVQRPQPLVGQDCDPNDDDDQQEPGQLGDDRQGRACAGRQPGAQSCEMNRSVAGTRQMPATKGQWRR